MIALLLLLVASPAVAEEVAIDDPPPATPSVQVEAARRRGDAVVAQGGHSRCCCRSGEITLRIDSTSLDRSAQLTTAPASPRFALAQNRPNPFNLSTEIGFELSARAGTRLRIYDVAGRLVRSVLDEMREAGPHVVVWDGRDGTGREVSSGVYFYRLEAGGFTETRQLLALK